MLLFETHGRTRSRRYLRACPETRVSLALLLLLLWGCSGPEPDTKSKDPYERYLGLREILVERNFSAEPDVVRLLDDPSYLVATGALEVMAGFGRKEYLPYALPRLKAEHPMVRAQACETVAVVGGPEGRAPVMAVLRTDADPAVRRAAIKVLAAHYGADPEVRKLLVETVADKDPGVAYNAHERLSDLTGRKDIPRSRDAWAAVVSP
jgi:HEAT repeat protein